MFTTVLSKAAPSARVNATGAEECLRPAQTFQRAKRW
jgi:hypothetical protein